MKILVQALAAAAIAGLLAAPAGAQSPAHPPPAPPSPPKVASFKITDSFTAQRRPRVTVLTFDNTNQNAQDAKYGPAVEAMLVTFLKRKSQFVVVERQKIDKILEEKVNIQFGKVKVAADDQEAQELLEKVDVFVLGSVTLLDLPNTRNNGPGTPGAGAAGSPDAVNGGGPPNPPDGETAKSDGRDPQSPPPDEEQEPSADGGMFHSIPILRSDLPEESPETKDAGKRWTDLAGPRIEIDVKLISRFDGRIVAAAQRSGPVACLRSIVERLGVALEQEFLRPYYGTLTVTLNEPEHIRVFLTPILPADALDEEKPPVERSTTVTIGGDRDKVEPWTTDPTTYTIKNLLSGWYSMRIERPGYTEINLENARWEVRKQGNKDVVYDLANKVPLDRDPLELKRFVVRVTPLTSDVLDIKSLQFAFNKEGGSFTPLVKRQYLDTDYLRGPQRVLLVGGPKIDLNRIDSPGEYADDPKCDLFQEETPALANYGRTYVTAGQKFNFDQFTGGELIIEDYQGEVVPVGRYSMALWEPSYQLEQTLVTVRNNDRSSIKVALTRETSTLELGSTGPRPSSHAVLKGRETRHSLRLPLDFTKVKEVPGVPVDTYTASTDIPELSHWSHGVEIPSANLNAPFYDTASKKNEPQILQAGPRPEAVVAPFVGVKTRFGLAGRLRVLSRKPDPMAAGLFVDRDIAKILNLLLYGVENRREDEEDRPSLKEASAQAGREVGRNTAPPQEASPPSQSDPQSKPAPPPPPAFPRDPDVLRKLLAERLELIDLLVLDPVDMTQLRESPDVAGILTRWVAAGGTLFAFVSSPGDYRDVVGAPLTIEAMSKKTKRFDLAPGKVPGLVQVAKKKVKSKGRRRLPEIDNLDRSWRVLAYTRSNSGPRIIEKAAKGEGHVVLWFDDPESFRGFFGGTRPEVEQTRANVEGHVLRAARSLMRSRFGEGVAETVSRKTSP
jgi:hypothetical protein